MAWLNGECQAVVRILHLHEIEERSSTAGIGTSLRHDADLGVLEAATEREHVRGEIQRLRVDAQTGKVGPVSGLRAAVLRRVEDIVPPRAERIGAGGYREKEDTRVWIRPEGSGQQHPSRRMLIVEQLGIEARLTADDVREPLREGPLEDHGSADFVVDRHTGID